MVLLIFHLLSKEWNLQFLEVNRTYASYMHVCKTLTLHISYNELFKKWCIHLSRSLYLYLNYLVSVTAGGPMSPRGTCSQVLYCRLRLIRSVLRALNFSVFKVIEIVICWFITPSLLASICFGTFWLSFSTFKTTLFG